MQGENLIGKGVVSGPRVWGEVQGKRGGTARSRVAVGAAMAFGKEKRKWEGKSEIGKENKKLKIVKEKSEIKKYKEKMKKCN